MRRVRMRPPASRHRLTLSSRYHGALIQGLIALYVACLTRALAGNQRAQPRNPFFDLFGRHGHE